MRVALYVGAGWLVAGLIVVYVVMRVRASGADVIEEGVELEPGADHGLFDEGVRIGQLVVFEATVERMAQTSVLLLEPMARIVERATEEAEQ